MKLIGTLSVLEIQRQINEATLKMLQNYSQLLETGNEKAIKDFIWEETDRTNNRMDLVGNNFKVNACVKGIPLQYQSSSYNLCRVLEYGLRDEDGSSIYCSQVSPDEEVIEFWYDD